MPAAPMHLLVESVGAPHTFRFRVTFPAPAADAAERCAPAALVFGDGQSAELGLLCAPTAITWREQRLADLGTHTYAGPGPYTAELRWGEESQRLTITLDGAPRPQVAATLPEVALFQLKPVAEQPYQRRVSLRVTGLADGQQVRLDGGAGQIYLLAGLAADESAEWLLTYAKPGGYRVTAELLDADGYWLATLAESPLDIADPTVLAEVAVPLRPSAAEIEALAVAAEPWLPYRNVRPVRSTATYTRPGGSTIQRYVGTGAFLSARAETSVGGQRWLQTALGDWIAENVVTYFVPSALRGVELGDVTPPPPPPPPPPAGTRRGIVTADALNVRARPGVAADNPPIATLRAGTEVTIYEERAVSGATWYRIGENRWVHGGYVRLLASDPTPPPPPPADTRRGVVTADVLNVRARPGVAANNPPVATLRAGAEVTIYEEQTVSGAAWYRIGEDRWVAGQWVRVISTATRAATTAAAAHVAALPLGWVVADSLNVRARPGVAANNPPIRQLGHYAVVPILGQQYVGSARWYQIGAGEWVEGQWIGVARLRARPSSIGASERWVGVSLAEQTLVAYEGDRPVFAALIASGLPGTPTVQGIFHTWRRLETGKMSGPGYYIEDVTWTCYFYSGYALHTAYWHDAFGRPRSHGCVNLSPHDAWWLYQWSAPGGPNSPAVYTYWA